MKNKMWVGIHKWTWSSFILFFEQNYSRIWPKSLAKSFDEYGSIYYVYVYKPMYLGPYSLKVSAKSSA